MLQGKIGPFSGLSHGPRSVTWNAAIFYPRGNTFLCGHLTTVVEQTEPKKSRDLPYTCGRYVAKQRYTFLKRFTRLKTRNLRRIGVW